MPTLQIAGALTHAPGRPLLTLIDLESPQAPTSRQVDKAQLGTDEQN